MSPYGIFDHGKWRDQVLRLIEVTPRHASEIVKEESRYALEFVSRFTPPNNQGEGRKAVKRDILKTMRPLVPKDITENERLKRVVMKDNQAEFNELTKHITSGPLRGAIAVPFSPETHHRRRDKRGRVLSESRQVVLGSKNSTLLRRHITAMQGRVGWAKAGWAAALKKVGGSVPAWVDRHRMTAGYVIDELNTESPQLTVVNNTAWAARDGGRVVRNALNVRSNVMRRKVDKLVRELAAQSGATVV